MWNKEMFPDPVEMTRDVEVVERKVVTIVDPHLKRVSHGLMTSVTGGPLLRTSASTTTVLARSALETKVYIRTHHLFFISGREDFCRGSRLWRILDFWTEGGEAGAANYEGEGREEESRSCDNGTYDYHAQVL
ncbi:uncharacterized protein HD556DRAFT_1311165 [Suillus plorans]|uniref:Uncharacterized protein n=1 Tax=Suillus plorans TaxID=116603 RepID=A0A9P7AIV3_9AGAM|nr:uncharacterized protein HD556DRAFT_1311165 [Suillus plorans]KAG1789781.1 hypothetical protein HD556DRAFT_1311165 [Suillus plorans]